MEDDKSSGDGVDVDGTVSFAYSDLLCFQELTMTAPSASSVYAYLVDDVTFSFTETCEDLIDVYYCLSDSTSTSVSCDSNVGCSAAGQSTSSTGVYTYSFDLQAGSGVAGYQLACVQDNANSLAFAYSSEFCVQDITVTSVTGGSDSGTFAYNAGVNVDTITIAWDVSCNVEHSVYQCSSYDTANTCSSSVGCSLIGSTTSTDTAPTYDVVATDLNTGLLYFCVQDTSESSAYDYYSTEYCLQDMSLGTVYGTYYGEANYGFVQE